MAIKWFWGHKVKDLFLYMQDKHEQNIKNLQNNKIKYTILRPFHQHYKVRITQTRIKDFIFFPLLSYWFWGNWVKVTVKLDVKIIV
jgi:hypothetical protein